MRSRQVAPECLGDQRVRPQFIVVEQRDDLVLEATVQIVAHGPSVIIDLRQWRDARTAGESTEQVRRSCEPFGVPRPVMCRHLLEPDGAGELIDVDDGERPRHGQAVGEPVSQVRPVDGHLGSPRHRRRGHLADLGWNDCEVRRPRPVLHLFDKDPKGHLPGRRFGTAADPPQTGRRDRRHVIVDRLDANVADADGLLVEMRRHDRLQLSIGHICGTEKFTVHERKSTLLPS